MLRIGGVPEHFNLPWRDVLADRDDEWIDVDGGSGAMARALDGGELDIAVMLTESAVRAIGDGLACIPSRLHRMDTTFDIARRDHNDSGHC